MNVRTKADSFRGTLNPRDVEALDRNLYMLFQDLAAVAARVDADPVRLTPTRLAANAHNYAPLGWDTADVLRLAAIAAVDLTGIRGGTPGKLLTIINIGTETITLKASSTSSSPPNRFKFAADHALTQGQTASVCWDEAGFWCPIAFGT